MSFDISRLRRAEEIVGGGAIALFIFMFFFKWFGGSVSGALPTGDVSAASSSSTGWQTFTNSRWIWLITIIVAIGSVVIVAGGQKLELPVQPGAIVAGLGAFSTLLILYRIFHHPSASASFGSFHASYGIKIGIWLGLIASSAITYGGYLQMQQESALPSASREPEADAFGGMTVAGVARTTAPPISPEGTTSLPPAPAAGEETPPAAQDS
jgi:hypothetical protein